MFDKPVCLTLQESDIYRSQISSMHALYELNVRGCSCLLSMGQPKLVLLLARWLLHHKLDLKVRALLFVSLLYHELSSEIRRQCVPEKISEMLLKETPKKQLYVTYSLYQGRNIKTGLDGAASTFDNAFTSLDISRSQIPNQLYGVCCRHNDCSFLGLSAAPWVSDHMTRQLESLTSLLNSKYFDN